MADARRIHGGAAPLAAGAGEMMRWVVAILALLPLLADAAPAPLSTLPRTIAQPPPPSSDPRFAWIRAIEMSGGYHQLRSNATYYIDRQYVLPDGTTIVGGGSTTVLAVATRPVQQQGHFHGCGPNHVNRIGFVLGSRCRIAQLHYVGIERARYPDSHPMCGGAPFQTPGCATPYCAHASSGNASWLIGTGRPVRDSVVEDITLAGGTVQNAFWMPETPQGRCENITARRLVVLGACPQPGPCRPSSSSSSSSSSSPTGTSGGGTWADGINIHGAHSGILVEDNHITHSGDDTFAMWSRGSAETEVTFRGNYAASPRYPRSWLASCFAMYGGNKSSFVNNTCVQSGSRGAIYLTNGFNGAFLKNVSFATVFANHFSNCCPISKSVCGIHGPVLAPGCRNASRFHL
jgi:hypothetical protein